MKIDAIDVYWVKLPLAFVWKTSYADQSFTDTILVRMEGGGHEAWGESCPPFIPGYSAEHTLAVFHTLREHMVPRIIGQDIETAQDLLDRLAFIRATSSRGPRSTSPGGCWTPSGAACRCTAPSAGPPTAWRWAPTSGSRTRSTP